MELIEIGKVVKLHGYLGQMKVNSRFDDDFDISFSSKRIASSSASLRAISSSVCFFFALFFVTFFSAILFRRDGLSNNSVSVGQSLSTEYLNKFADYAEKVTDIHCERLRSGRDIGFWNAGVYVLSNSEFLEQ